MRKAILSVAFVVAGVALVAAQTGNTNTGNNNTVNGKTGTKTNSTAPTNPGNKYLEYNYDKLGVKERKIVPYAPLREADVIYAKRIHRVIDTREKKNLVMQWPKNPLNKIIYSLVTTGEKTASGKLKAYFQDSLDRTMTIEQVKKLGGFCEVISVQIDPNDPYNTKDSTVCTDFDYSSVKRWEVYEEWLFDKQAGMFFPRIIGVAPLYKPNVQGIDLPEQPMFWVSWDELRNILINEEVFNPQNDAMRLTYDDFFEQRLFSSYIIKESNELDLAIKDAPEFKDNPMEALYESERIKGELFNWEHNLWEY